jgi:hypothetical protein
MREAVDAELRGMAGQYERGGIDRLARFIALRSRQPGASLYFVVDPAGAKIAGNVESVPVEVLNRPDPAPQVVPYSRLDEQGPGSRYAALVRVIQLPDGFRLLVGRDISESEELVSVVQRALILTVALMIALVCCRGSSCRAVSSSASTRWQRRAGGSWRAICRAGWKSPARATSSTGSPKASIRC